MVNIVFTRIIRVSEGQLEFNFRKLSGEIQNFHADVTDPRGNRIQFSINQNIHGAWHLTGTLLPLWIVNAEQVIGQTIEEEMALINTH